MLANGVCFTGLCSGFSIVILSPSKASSISFVGEGLADLGFEMDCGESFKTAFPNCNLGDCEAWKRIVNQIDSVQLLGDAIFSQWRYWNHWSNTPMEEADFEWFVIAFSRLAELAT